MASGDGIQVDQGGFVRIHNTILELLAKAPLRGQQFRCLMFLFRKTYGYNKKEDKISLKEWASGTNMERHNVWRELQILLKCNMIYCISHGPKRAMTWGFNKYHEKWNFESVVADDYKSVVTDDDSFGKSVVTGDYTEEQSVVTIDYKSVVTDSHTRELKDSKDKQSLLAASESDDVMGLMQLAYQTVCKIGPPTREPTGRAALIVASDLIERFGYDACIRGLSTLKERYDATIKKHRHGIDAPLPYLRSIMEGELGVRLVTPTKVDFALEDISQ